MFCFFLKCFDVGTALLETARAVPSQNNNDNSVNSCKASHGNWLFISSKVFYFQCVTLNDIIYLNSITIIFSVFRCSFDIT